MRILSKFGVVAAAAALHGCAYMTTYKSDIGDPTTGISIDAKQRVVLVSKAGGKTKICAEPSPDALSALGASLGASVLAQSGAIKQLSAALGEQSASMGLRTTSIQLMRDSMYRVCEAYLGDGIDAKTYADLQAHSQDLVVGLLAIEQLTGAVAAQQVSLSTTAGAGSGDSGETERAHLVEARKASVAQRRVVQDAQKTASDLKGEVKAAEEKLQEATEAEESKPEDIDALKTEVAELKSRLGKAEADAAEQAELLKIHEAAEKMAQDALNLAVSRTRASVGGGGKFTQNTQGGMSDETAQAVSNSVVAIVDKILGVGAKAQQCMQVLRTPFPPTMGAAQQTALLEYCGAVTKQIEEDAKAMRQQQYKMPPSPPSPR